MKKVAAERRRFGYRRIHVMLDRQGIHMNQKKLRRLYREEGLQVRKRGGRKRALGTRRPMLLPTKANERWSLDFVSDAFTDGRRFRVLAVVDDYSRECLSLVADTSLSGIRVHSAELKKLPVMPEPTQIPSLCQNGQGIDRKRVLNGTTFSPANPLSAALGLPAGQRMQNGFVESFNGSFRDECLNEDIACLARVEGIDGNLLKKRFDDAADGFAACDGDTIHLILTNRKPNTWWQKEVQRQRELECMLSVFRRIGDGEGKHLGLG
ncbi:unnamed protein product [Effrenium voratum]|nr:unnamed protein product [Effrenium voratum]